MSVQTKKTNSRGTANKKKQTPATKKTQAPEQGLDENLLQEVILWVMLAVSAVLFVSNFGIGGKIGDLLSNVMFGIFGLMSYLFPVCLFVGTVFILSNKNNRIAVIKLVAAVLFVFFLCFFLELVSGSATDYSPVKSYLNGVSERNGGGFIGGVFAWLICPNFGRVSAYVIDMIFLIITMVVVTERSAWKHVQKGGRRMYASAKEGNEKLREIQEQRREERELRRMERKVSGVSQDTLLVSDTHGSAPSDALTEITPESFAKRSAKQTLVRNTQPEIKNVSQEPRDDGDLFEPQVTAQHQVSLQPAGNMEPTREPEQTQESVASQGSEMPAFSPELQKLFAHIDEEASQPAAAEENDDFELPSIELPQDLLRRGESETDLTENIEHIENIQNTEPLRLIEPKTADNVTVFANEPPSQPDAPNVQETVTSAAETDQQSTERETEAASRTPVRNPKQDAQTVEEGIQEVAEQISEQEQEHRTYVYPPLDLLKKGDPTKQGDSKQHLQETALKLQQTLKNFGVNVTILNVSCGPTVTRYEIQPEMGVKVSKIVNLTDDIKLNLAAADIRMEAPIPGKAAIGIEVPNKETLPVMFGDLVSSPEFQEHPSAIAFAAGRDIGGQVIMADIAKMPHLLIAGATGSGKSVCINTIIMSLLYRADPEDVKLILIDPKVVELSVYNGIPHLFIPVVTDPKKAAGALNWAVAEMTERYNKFAEYGVRDLKGYNAKVASIADIDDPAKPVKLPQIVIIVDELADLMMVAPGDVEDAICRLAQLARACGIHLIIATQRPSVNVITGLIKANMPSRMAFSVTSGVDSRTILDMVGAEKLLGKGDCLYYPQGLNKPLRVQGAFVSDQEVANVVDFIKETYGNASYDNTIEEKMSRISEGAGNSTSAAVTGTNDNSGRDAYFVDAAKLLMDKDKASIGMLQRYFKVGFNRAARIMDQLEEAGVVGPEEGTKPRQIMMNPETFESLLEDGSF